MQALAVAVEQTTGTSVIEVVRDDMPGLGTPGTASIHSGTFDRVGAAGSTAITRTGGAASVVLK